LLGSGGLGGSGGGGTGSLTYVLDTFGGTTAALTTHTPDINSAGGGWTNQDSSGDFRTNSSGTVKDEAAGNSEHWVTVDAGAADCVLRVTISSGIGAGIDSGFLVRIASTASGNAVTHDTNASESKIWRIAAGSWTALSSATATWSNGDRHVVVVQGTTIISYQNGTELTRAVSTQNITNTNFGLRRHAGGGIEYDNFSIDDQFLITT